MIVPVVGNKSSQSRLPTSPPSLVEAAQAEAESGVAEWAAEAAVARLVADSAQPAVANFAIQTLHVTGTHDVRTDAKAAAVDSDFAPGLAPELAQGCAPV